MAEESSNNIAIFADGTWNHHGLRNQTNVYKLYKFTLSNNNQCTFYDPGVGTNKLRYTGGMFGVGISKNIIECYNYIVANYQPGDRIYLFGFSRGAFTVRSLASLLSIVGIVKRSMMSEMRLKEAYSIYRGWQTYPCAAELFRKKYCYPLPSEQESDENGPSHCIPHFIGVWDTVGALGIPFSILNFFNPFPHSFHNVNLQFFGTYQTCYAYHAISINDRRRAFLPTLWQDPYEVVQLNESRQDESKQDESKQDESRQDESRQDESRQDQATEAEKAPELCRWCTLSSKRLVEQAWFPGAHADVGGGYLECSLSDLALKWIARKAHARGLILAKDWKSQLRPEYRGMIHDPTDKMGFSLMTKTDREVGTGLASTIHISVLKRMVEDRTYQPKLPIDIPHHTLRKIIEKDGILDQYRRKDCDHDDLTLRFKDLLQLAKYGQ
ncbi:hypothetical protein Rhal01_03825 [Rubritalea halochordaticola]|uniref:T6SS Phospholipase effector Tle1-like catalytic domain-containing protein n=1 Tax=Rubritalea halochordaticola TaxID=714537 RepID=A0ABP9V7V1_9BACT